MNTAVAVVNNGPSVMVDMANRYGMDPRAFEATMRATVVPAECSREQMAAFLLVAKEYNLNPLTKEIYAFPTRGGGIQPIVSIDGWCNLINSHTMLNGIEFDDHASADGKALTAITARIWRKDRDKPITVTEYMDECNRKTDTWTKWPRRMLRHKALIQCARYAFGFAGIIDPDEADRLDVPERKPEAAKLVTVKRPPPPDEPAPAPVAETVNPPHSLQNPDDWLKFVEATLAAVTDPETLGEVWETKLQAGYEAAFPPDQIEAMALYRRAETRLAP